MHTEKREDPLVELGYEIRDVNHGALLKGVIGLFIFTIASCVIGWIMFRIMYPSGFENAKAPNRLIPESPNPLLQSNIMVKTDIMDLRQSEEKALTAAPHWVDASKTKVAIPIDRAMEIIAERGITKTNGEVPAVSKGHTPNLAIGEKAASSVDLSKATPSAAVSVPLTPVTKK